MEAINLGAFFTFVIVTTYTPGPNNITSSSMGILYGYRKTINYLIGICVGFFGIMLLSGIVSGSLYAIFPSLEMIMRITGSGYILWLAYKTLKTSYQFSSDESPILGFSNGLLLQIFNPKVWIYGLTLYTTFLASITGNILWLLFTSIFLACVAFTATSTWAISGAAIKQFLANQALQKTINIILALLLIYTAIELSGVF